MMEHGRTALGEAGVVCLMGDASESFGHGDQFVIDMLRETSTKRFAILNKIDLVKKNSLLPLMQQYSGFELFDQIVPVSAASGDGVEHLVSLFFDNMPAGAAIYSKEDFTPQPERFFAARIVPG